MRHTLPLWMARIWPIVVLLAVLHVVALAFALLRSSTTDHANDAILFILATMLTVMLAVMFVQTHIWTARGLSIFSTFIGLVLLYVRSTLRQQDILGDSWTSAYLLNLTRAAFLMGVVLFLWYYYARWRRRRQRDHPP